MLTQNIKSRYKKGIKIKNIKAVISSNIFLASKQV